MEDVVITQFSNPMMGLSWECGPALRKVRERFGDAVELREAGTDAGSIPAGHKMTALIGRG